MSYFDDNENFDMDLLKALGEEQEEQEEQENSYVEMYADLYNRYIEVCNENDVLRNKIKVLEALKNDEKDSKDSKDFENK